MCLPAPLSAPTGLGVSMTKYVGDLAASLTEELFEVVHKYDESLLVATVLGCLEIVKQQILIDHIEEDDDD